MEDIRIDLLIRVFGEGEGEGFNDYLGQAVAVGRRFFPRANGVDWGTQTKQKCMNTNGLCTVRRYTMRVGKALHMQL